MNALLQRLIARFESTGTGVPTRARRLLTFVGYAGFFVTCFVAFAYFTFPYERLRSVFEQRFSIPSSDGVGGQKVVIGELSPHWLTGVALSDVVVERGPDVPNGEPSKLAFDEITVRASAFSLLVGAPEVSFGAEAGGGDISGVYASDAAGNPTGIEAELSSLDIGMIGLGGFLGVPLEGRATGTIELDIGEASKDTSGAIELQIEGFRLGDGKTKVKVPGMPGGLTIDPIDAGSLQLKVTLKEGVATVEQLEAKGEDLELSGSGSVRLAEALANSRTDVTIGFKFADAYKKKSDRTKSVFELLGANPLLQRATGRDGTVRLQVSGPLTSLSSRAAAPSSTARAEKRKRSKGKGSSKDEDRDTDEEK